MAFVSSAEPLYLASNPAWVFPPPSPLPQRLLLVLRERSVPMLFPAANIRQYDVTWHPDGITLEHHKDHVYTYCADVQVRGSHLA